MACMVSRLEEIGSAHDNPLRGHITRGLLQELREANVSSQRKLREGARVLDELIERFGGTDIAVEEEEPTS